MTFNSAYMSLCLLLCYLFMCFLMFIKNYWYSPRFFRFTIYIYTGWPHFYQLCFCAWWSPQINLLLFIQFCLDCRVYYQYLQIYLCIPSLLLCIVHLLGFYSLKSSTVYFVTTNNFIYLFRLGSCVLL